MEQDDLIFKHRIVPQSIARNASFMGDPTLEAMRTVQRNALKPIVDIDDLHRATGKDQEQE